MQSEQFELLLVEDNSADAGLIQAHLRIGLGTVTVRHVERLADAFIAVDEHTYSAVLLDLNLPDSSGVETFHRFSAQSNGVPVIVLSGMEDSNTAIEAVSAGAEDYVQKGDFDANILAKSIRFAIERRNRLIAEQQRDEIRTEMMAAQRLQDSLYPDKCHVIDAFDIAAGIKSAGIGCGDYYDFIKLNDGRLVTVVGDVSGHGMKSAMVMAETRACLRTLADVDVEPERMLTAMNRLIHSSAPDGMFVTLMLLVHDPTTRSFQYFSAGHPAWILRGDEGHLVDSQQIPLGLLPETEYSDSDHFTMNSGDVLILPTDGIIESATDDELFGTNRLIQTVARLRNQSASDTVNELIAEALRFAGVNKPVDDMTAIVFKAL